MAHIASFWLSESEWNEKPTEGCPEGAVAAATGN
jgi:hypothetical protein